MRYRYVALISVFCLLVGFGYAKFLTPERVSVVTKVHTVEVESREAQATIAALRSELAQTKRHTFRTEVVVAKPDGTVTTTKTEDEHLEHKTETKALTVAEATEKATTTKTTETVTAKETVNAKASVKLTAMVGYDFAARAPVYGGAAQGRVAGPFWVGGWATTTGGLPAAGVSLSLEF